jgi:hypothetical protein
MDIERGKWSRAVREGQLSAGDGQASGVAAHADDDAVRFEAPPVGKAHRALPHEPCRAGLLVDGDAHALQVMAELLLLVQSIDDALRLGQERGEVDLGRGQLDAVGRSLGRVAYQTGGTGQDAGRSAAVVRAGAAQQRPLQERHARPELRGTQGSRDTGRTAAQNEHMHGASLRGRGEMCQRGVGHIAPPQ